MYGQSYRFRPDGGGRPQQPALPSTFFNGAFQNSNAFFQHAPAFSPHLQTRASLFGLSRTKTMVFLISSYPTRVYRRKTSLRMEKNMWRRLIEL
ncbi:hypothetical protein L6164_025390 [Bauhinia variegata]|uniref:Uncharacterized protein n=1 Tax=Bauhinia variegata TaxID=167791 RepID=A0ACB9M0R1_BAUVA|nr:hypothetical protein L6164_025390 [Bauhinia variegata]